MLLSSKPQVSLIAVVCFRPVVLWILLLWLLNMSMLVLWKLQTVRRVLFMAARRYVFLFDRSPITFIRRVPALRNLLITMRWNPRVHLLVTFVRLWKVWVASRSRLLPLSMLCECPVVVQSRLMCLVSVTRGLRSGTM